jgi:transposase
MWAKRGKQPKVKSAPTQEKVAFSGFINPNTGQLIIKECNKFNYETIMEAIYHFQKTQNTDRKVLIIMDNAPWHKKAVRLLREENIENIEFLFLPPYSPELNPIERIWRITRRERTHNVYFDKLELLRERLLTYFMQFSTSNIKLKILCHNYNYL